MKPPAAHSQIRHTKPLHWESDGNYNVVDKVHKPEVYSQETMALLNSVVLYMSMTSPFVLLFPSLYLFNSFSLHGYLGIFRLIKCFD